MLFDLGSEIDIDSAREEGVRMGAAEHSRIFVISAGNVEHVDFVVDHLGYFDIFGKTDADIGHVIAVESDLNREDRADCGTDGIENQQKEAGAVFKGAAELVCSAVEIRRKEL